MPTISGTKFFKCRAVDCDEQYSPYRYTAYGESDLTSFQVYHKGDIYDGSRYRIYLTGIDVTSLPAGAVLKSISVTCRIDPDFNTSTMHSYHTAVYWSSYYRGSTMTAQEMYYSDIGSSIYRWSLDEGDSQSAKTVTFQADVPSSLKRVQGGYLYLYWEGQSWSYGGNIYNRTLNGSSNVDQISWTLTYDLNTAPTASYSGSSILSPGRPSLKFYVYDSNGDSISRIQVQISTDSAFSNIILDNTYTVSAGSSSNVSVTPNTDISPGKYYIRVRAYDGYAWGNWSAASSITVNSGPETEVKHVTPNGYTLNQYPKLFFSVSDIDGNTITNVEVQIARSDSFSDVVWQGDSASGVFSGLPAASGGTVALTVPIALSPGTYYVRARAYDSISWGPYSAPVAFTVASPPWSDTIPADVTTFKAEWMNQIAEAINAARQFRGLPTVSFTDGTIVAGQTDIKAVHVTERQKALQEVLTTIGVWKEICPDGGAESGTARYKGSAYRTNADKYVGSYCHALPINVDWNGVYLVPSSGYTFYPGIVYRVAAMVKNPTPQSGFINIYANGELWDNSGLGAKTLPADMDWTLYEWFFTVEEIKTVTTLRIEESGFNGYSGEIYLDLLTLQPAWTHELNLLATTVLGADTDWSKWQHYNSTNWHYWDNSSLYNHELYGYVFQGQAVTDKPTAFLFLYGNYSFMDYPFAVKAGQPYLFGLWVKLSPGQTATATVRAYFRKPDGSNVAQEDRQVTLTQDWQYLEFVLTPTRSMNVGVGWAFTGIQGLTLHAAMPVVRPLVDRSGIHIQELRNYLLHT